MWCDHNGHDDDTRTHRQSGLDWHVTLAAMNYIIMSIVAFIYIFFVFSQTYFVCRMYPLKPHTVQPAWWWRVITCQCWAQSIWQRAKGNRIRLIWLSISNNCRLISWYMGKLQNTYFYHVYYRRCLCGRCEWLLWEHKAHTISCTWMYHGVRRQ